MAKFGGDDGDPVEWVTVYQAMAVEEAHVVKGHLEEEDIPVLLKTESGSVLGSSGLMGVRVQVPSTLEDRARELLDVE